MDLPPISHYMTRAPHVIGARDTVASARAVMRNLRIHHLLVVDEGELIGIVSDRELGRLAWSDEPILDVMSRGVVIVPPSATLDRAVEQMQTTSADSVVVCGAEGIEGIFTPIDAVRALSDVLHRLEGAH